MVERIFGVLKACWRVLVYPLRYSMSVQVRISAALAAIHNLIIQYDPVECSAFSNDDGDSDEEDTFDPTPQNRDTGILAQTMALPPEETERHKARRDAIAQEMWESYQLWLQNHNMDIDM